MRKLLALVLCMFMVVGVAAGCGSAVAESDVTYKKEVIVGVEGKLVTFDPQNSSIAPMKMCIRDRAWR